MKTIKMVTYNLSFEVYLDTFYPTSKARCKAVCDIMNLHPDLLVYEDNLVEVIDWCIDNAAHNMQIGKLAISKKYFENAKTTFDILKKTTDSTITIPDWLDIVSLSSDPLIRAAEGLPV